jgi:ADP-ribose pyrophosphatase YjhB (NUDIX family)
MMQRAGVILFSPNKKYVLLVKMRSSKHQIGKWGFPKGSVEKNEYLNMCAMRELKEETGLSINIEKEEMSNMIKRCFNKKKNISYYYSYILNNSMMGEIMKIIKSHKNESEIDILGFVPIEKCNDLILNSDTKKLLTHYEYCLKKAIKL